MSTTRSTFNGVTTPSEKPSTTKKVIAPTEVPFSRFKMTEILLDGGQLRYGLWEAPDIQLLGNEQTFTIPVELEHRPDLLSYNFYGTVDLWWVIPYVNNILLPIRDLVAGMTVVVPSRTKVDTALQRTRK